MHFGVAAAIPGDAAPELAQTIELVDVDTDEFARIGASEAAHRFGGREGAHAAQASLLQDQAHRDRRGLGRFGDRRAAPPLAPQCDDVIDLALRRRAVRRMRKTGAADEASGPPPAGKRLIRL